MPKQNPSANNGGGGASNMGGRGGVPRTTGGISGAGGKNVNGLYRPNVQPQPKTDLAKSQLEDYKAAARGEYKPEPAKSLPPRAPAVAKATGAPKPPTPKVKPDTSRPKPPNPTQAPFSGRRPTVAPKPPQPAKDDSAKFTDKTRIVQKDSAGRTIGSTTKGELEELKVKMKNAAKNKDNLPEGKIDNSSETTQTGSNISNRKSRWFREMGME